MNNRKPKSQKYERKAHEFEDLLGRKALKEIPVGEIVKPYGYAYSIAKLSKAKNVQLRKLYAELKHIIDERKRIKDEELSEEEKKSLEARLYMLYPILEYQQKRELIGKELKDVMQKLVEKLINGIDDVRNFERAEQFLTALVAYAKD